MVLLSMKTTGPYLKNKEHLTGSLSNIEKKKTLNMSLKSILGNFKIIQSIFSYTFRMLCLISL